MSGLGCTIGLYDRKVKRRSGKWENTVILEVYTTTDPATEIFYCQISFLIEQVRYLCVLRQPLAVIWIPGGVLRQTNLVRNGSMRNYD